MRAGEHTGSIPFNSYDYSNASMIAILGIL